MALAKSFTWYHTILAHACGLTFIRETTPNAGEGVIACQKVTGNEPPASWCCSACAKIAVDVYQDAWPLVRSGACEDVRRDYEKHHALVTIADMRASIAKAQLFGYPVRSELGAGWQFFTVATLKDAAGAPLLHAHHTGWVGLLAKNGQITGFLDDGFVTTEGNAADPTKPPSDDGNGLYSGRVRGNVRPIMYAGKLWPADSKVYHFGRPDLL